MLYGRVTILSGNASERWLHHRISFAFFIRIQKNKFFFIFSSWTWPIHFLSCFFSFFIRLAPKILSSKQNPGKESLYDQDKKRFCHVHDEITRKLTLVVLDSDKKRNWPRDDVIFHSPFRIKQLPSRTNFFSLLWIREIIFVQVKSRNSPSSADSVMTVRLLKRELVFQYKPLWFRNKPQNQARSIWTSLWF